MKAKAVSLLLALTALLFIHSAASAMVLVHMRKPDVEFSFATAPDDLRDLRSILLNFAAEEKFIPFKNNALFAKGKKFYLSLHREPSILIVAEQKSANEPMKVSCWDFNRGGSDFERITDRLGKILRHRWPHLVVTYAPPLTK